MKHINLNRLGLAVFASMLALSLIAQAGSLLGKMKVADT